MRRIKVNEDPQEALARLNISKPLDGIMKFKKDGTLSLAYQHRLDLEEKAKKNQSAHRYIIFGDDPDITLNPQLDKIGG